MTRSRKPPVEFSLELFFTFHSVPQILKILPLKNDLISWCVRLNLANNREEVQSTRRDLLARKILESRLSQDRDAPVPRFICEEHIKNLTPHQFMYWCDLFGCADREEKNLRNCIKAAVTHVYEMQHPEVPSGYPHKIRDARKFDEECELETIQESNGNERDAGSIEVDVSGDEDDDVAGDEDDDQVSLLIFMFLCKLLHFSVNY